MTTLKDLYRHQWSSGSRAIDELLGPIKYSVRYQIKLVADARPNDDGIWSNTRMTPPLGLRWRELEEFFRFEIPAGYHMVAIQTVIE